MLELITVLVGAVNPLYAILKRHYDVNNTNAQARLQIASELKEACEQWSSILEQTFDAAVAVLDQRGPDAARDEIARQQADFTKLDYHALAYDSPALATLRSDPKLTGFAEACSIFYRKAIGTKELAYGTFSSMGSQVGFNMPAVSVAAVCQAWKGEVERSLAVVRSEYRRAQGLPQR